MFDYLANSHPRMKITPRPFRLATAAAILTLSLVSAFTAQAFTVTKDVNSGQAPVEKVVIFEKGQARDLLTFSDTPECKLAYTDDGSIESRITGNRAFQFNIGWKPRPGVPEALNFDDYDCVVLTCRMEGTLKVTAPNGKVDEKRGDNLWFPASLFDAAGKRVGMANLADATKDGRTPAQTTTLVIPKVLFTFWPQEGDPKKITSVGGEWNEARSNQQRDFRLVIDKIAFAKFE